MFQVMFRTIITGYKGLHLQFLTEDNDLLEVNCRGSFGEKQLKLIE